MSNGGSGTAGAAEFFVVEYKWSPGAEGTSPLEDAELRMRA